MASKNKGKNTQYSDRGSYNKYMLEEEQLRRSSLPDDDLLLDDPDIEEHQVRSKNAPAPGSIKEKMEQLRKAADERRKAKESLPKLEETFDGQLKTKTGRRKGVLALGIAICTFALIGLVTTVYLAASGITYLVKNNPALTRYDDIIAPVAYFDPAPFETLEGADAETLIYICLWETLTVNNEKYEISDNGKTVVPVADVDETAQRIFGSGARLDYSIFEGKETDIDYIPDSNTLEVFNTGIEGFTHKTLKVKGHGNEKEVTVGYIEPDSYGIPDETQKKDEYAKKMIYIVKKDDSTGKWYVSAVRKADD
ncbi:MAG: hypothetical protein IJL87_04230 [Clostridia bacterium]|nr:hypothetical protein [Clostridia bacterium]